MRRPDFYRYFLGVRPQPEFYPAFEAFACAAGQSVRLAMLHLTFCVIAECAERDRFIVRKVRRIFDGQPLDSFAVNLGTILTGPDASPRERSAGKTKYRTFTASVCCGPAGSSRSIVSQVCTRTLRWDTMRVR